MDDVTVRDNLLSFLAAGSETTATSLTWTLHYLALHPEVSQYHVGTLTRPSCPMSL
eukprot:m.54026 g.54026  ORF g.54026 m.54026 type:complete len:56 (-) comp13600_c0_seq2:695-862(-)